MRILRGRSNLEVSSQGFAVFVIGLVCATFLGGAVRTLLGSERIHDRIVNELKNRFPKHEFQIGKTEVLLSRGMWPGFGLRLRSVTFKQDVCGKLSFVLTLPEATLPLDMLALIRGTARLSDLEINGGELHLDYRACPPMVVVSPDTKEVIVKPNGEKPDSIKPPKLEWEKVARVLDGVDIKNFSITYEKNPTWKLVVNTANVDLGNDMNSQATIEVQKSLPFGTLTHPVEFELRADKNEMHWDVATTIKEGSVKIAGKIDVGTQASQLNVDLRNIPIREFMSEMYQMGFMDRDLTLKGAWLSCGLYWEGQLQDYTATPVGLHDCRVEGGYGRVELAKGDFWWNKPDTFREPAHFKVLQLQMRPLLEAFGRQVLPAVISQLGTWTGSFEFANKSAWKLDGDLENLEIVFVNQSLHGKQVVEKVHTVAAQKSGGPIEAKIDGVKLREGEFDGSIECDLANDWRSGNFDIDIKKVVVAPSIQRLLVGGGIAAVSARGQGTLAGGELNQWTGLFQIGDVNGEGWSLNAVQLRSTFRSGSFAVEGTAKRFGVNGSWANFPQVKNLVKDAPATVDWRDLTAKIELQKTGGTLHSLTAVQEGGTVWKSKGNWVRDGQFTGMLGLLDGKHAQNFAIRGERGLIVVQDKL